jgi:hypothetical protein
MNPDTLNALTQGVKNETPEMRTARLAEMKIRLREYDREIEKRAVSMAVSQALLDKTCTL